MRRFLAWVPIRWWIAFLEYSRRLQRYCNLQLVEAQVRSYKALAFDPTPLLEAQGFKVVGVTCEGWGGDGASLFCTVQWPKTTSPEQYQAIMDKWAVAKQAIAEVVGATGVTVFIRHKPQKKVTGQLP